MKYAALVAGAALFLTANAFSAEILSKEDFAKVQTQYQKVGTISSTGQTAPSDARAELLDVAEEGFAGGGAHEAWRRVQLLLAALRL